MEEPKLTSQQIQNELITICTNLGKLDENDGTYMKDRDCKACLKEMLRYLNSDSDLRTARITLGEVNVIKSDLIPMLVQYCDYHEGDSDLFMLILRIATNLTSSALLLFENQETPTEIEQMKLYNKLLSCLHGYKEAFASDEKIWALLNTHLRKTLGDEIAFERIIILIRNILHIPVDSTADMGHHSEFDIHDMCLYRMEKAGLLNTIIMICSETEKGTEYCFHLMEIIYLMLRDQNPETIAKSRPFTLKRKLDDDDSDKKRLAELSQRDRIERESRKMNTMQVRFRNTLFQAKNYRSLSEAPLIVKKPLCSLETLEFDEGKALLRKAKNKKPLSSETSMMISDKNRNNSKIAHGLKVFSQQFVEKVYSNYMQHIKHNLIQKKTQDNDESYYLWAIQYFTAFNRHMMLPLDNISETLSSSSLHYIQVLITTYQDKLKIERKKFEDISKRLHLAVRAYREILSLLKSIDSNSDFSRATETMKRHIFTELEYSTLSLTLFQSYVEPKHSSHYLTDLILTNDIFLELLEEYSKNHTTAEIQEAQEEDEKDDEEDQAEKVPGDNADAEVFIQKSPKKVKKKRKKKNSIDFKTAHFMTRYCCPVVISSYLSVLKSFRTNENKLNLAILKFLERIVFDCKNEVILMQASVLRCLLDIMSYHSSMPGKERFDSLTNHLVQTFGAMANKRRWMFQELLFWKSGTDILEIENAIEPPPVVLPEHRDIAEEEQLDAAEVNLEPEHEATQAESLAALLAELEDSSDDEIDESRVTNNVTSEELQQPEESIADLLAKLNDDSSSEFNDELPELSDDDSVHANDNSICPPTE